MTSKTYLPELLGAICVYIDNRIKFGNVLPTKDRRNYRCSKATLQHLKRAIDKENGRSFMQDRLLFAELYRPKVLSNKSVLGLS
jgi:hypothetical protein